MDIEPGWRPALACLLLLAGCPGRVAGAGRAAPAGATHPAATGTASLSGSKLARVVFPDGRSFLAEVAESPAARAKGLMFRKSLAPGEAMVFLFDTPDVYPFWMKNCLISLDILWMDPEGRVVHIEKSVPPCNSDPCPSVVPLRTSTWVIEVAAGQAARVRLGDQLLAGPEAAVSPKP